MEGFQSYGEKEGEGKAIFRRRVHGTNSARHELGVLVGGHLRYVHDK